MLFDGNSSAASVPSPLTTFIAGSCVCWAHNTTFLARKQKNLGSSLDQIKILGSGSLDNSQKFDLADRLHSIKTEFPRLAALKELVFQRQTHAATLGGQLLEYKLYERRRISIYKLHQRDTGRWEHLDTVRELIEGFDTKGDLGLGNIFVMERGDGHYWVMDGWQRVKAQRERGEKTIECIIFGSTTPDRIVAQFAHDANSAPQARQTVADDLWTIYKQIEANVLRQAIVSGSQSGWGMNGDKTAKIYAFAKKLFEVQDGFELLEQIQVHDHSDWINARSSWFLQTEIPNVLLVYKEPWRISTFLTHLPKAFGQGHGFLLLDILATSWYYSGAALSNIYVKECVMPYLNQIHDFLLEQGKRQENENREAAVIRLLFSKSGYILKDGAMKLRPLHPDIDLSKMRRSARRQDGEIELEESVDEDEGLVDAPKPSPTKPSGAKRTRRLRRSAQVDYTEEDLDEGMEHDQDSAPLGSSASSSSSTSSSSSSSSSSSPSFQPALPLSFPDMIKRLPTVLQPWIMQAAHLVGQTNALKLGVELIPKMDIFHFFHVEDTNFRNFETEWSRHYEGAVGMLLLTPNAGKERFPKACHDFATIVSKVLTKNAFVVVEGDWEDRAQGDSLLKTIFSVDGLKPIRELAIIDDAPLPESLLAVHTFSLYSRAELSSAHKESFKAQKWSIHLPAEVVRTPPLSDPRTPSERPRLFAQHEICPEIYMLLFSTLLEKGTIIMTNNVSGGSSLLGSLLSQNFFLGFRSLSLPTSVPATCLRGLKYFRTSVTQERIDSLKFIDSSAMTKVFFRNAKTLKADQLCTHKYDGVPMLTQSDVPLEKGRSSLIPRYLKRILTGKALSALVDVISQEEFQDCIPGEPHEAKASIRGQMTISIPEETKAALDFVFNKFCGWKRPSMKIGQGQFIRIPPRSAAQTMKHMDGIPEAYTIIVNLTPGLSVGTAVGNIKDVEWNQLNYLVYNMEPGDGCALSSLTVQSNPPNHSTAGNWQFRVSYSELGENLMSAPIFNMNEFIKKEIPLDIVSKYLLDSKELKLWGKGAKFPGLPEKYLQADPPRDDLYSIYDLKNLAAAGRNNDPSAIDESDDDIPLSDPASYVVCLFMS